jgi:cell division protein FtsX
MSRQTAEHIRKLLRTPTTDTDTPLEPVGVAKPEDVAQVRETLEQQNDLLRAILSSSVETQEDARATAQNSRTFAWAGTAIALLTLVATVISIVAAVRSH